MLERIGRWLGLSKRPPVPFKVAFARFRELLERNTAVLQLFADAAEKQNGEYIFDRAYVVGLVEGVFEHVGTVVADLNSIAGDRYVRLYEVFERLKAEAQAELEGRALVPEGPLCLSWSGIDQAQAALCGGKSAHLGELRARLEIPVPDGFTVTTHAYRRLLAENHLEDLITTVLAEYDEGRVSCCCGELAERLRTATVPRDVARAVQRALRELERAGGLGFLAVRSSALGEDEDLSFAGQYRTLLQVSPDGVLDAYREVIASLYTPGALAYRKAHGSSLEGFMAVLCMRMVPATTSGVLYTVDPNHPFAAHLLVGATRGLASRAVSGGQSMSFYEVSRDAPHAILARRAADTKDMVVGKSEGGVTTVELGAAERAEAELRPQEAAELAALALRVEQYFKQPQDIEWARGPDGRLSIIQARRLAIGAPAEPPTDLSASLAGYTVLMEQLGTVAARGVACGPVYLVVDPSELDGVPPGAVLVARRACPRFACVMPRIAAILTDIGSPTGHMATLAREFRLPTIVDCGSASTTLAAGQLVTVDADDNRVYEGRVEPLLRYQLVTETDFEDEPEYRLLRRLLRRMTPLSLLDPQSKDFRSSRCRTAHDIIRFAHEKAVGALIDLSERGAEAAAEATVRLDSELPLGLTVIDLGGGLELSKAAGSRRLIRPDALRSLPFCAVWKGLNAPGIWDTRPLHVGLGTFLSGAVSQPTGPNVGRNLAVVSEAYLNLSLNLGYHYNMVDAYLSAERDANHIYFRFVGGASEPERRVRRAAMVREILERVDFATRQTGDLVVARVRKMLVQQTEERLEVIGRLIGYARQLDALMDSEDDVMQFVEAFLRGDYAYGRPSEEGG